MLAPPIALLAFAASLLLLGSPAPTAAAGRALKGKRTRPARAHRGPAFDCITLHASFCSAGRCWRQQRPRLPFPAALGRLLLTAARRC